MNSAPPISLDYTLSDLYLVDNESSSSITLIYYSMVLRNSDMASPDKFTYQYRMQTEDASIESLIELSEKLRPQRNGFTAGKMPLVILDSNTPPNDRDLDAVHLARNFAQLRLDQQPIVSFATSTENIFLESGAQVAVLYPADIVSHLPHIINPEVHYEILSKRCLALSQLPTPPSTVIDTVLKPADIQDQTLLEHEVNRMIQPIDKYKLPFFVKLPQSISSKGVFKVSTDTDRATVKAIIAAQLGGMLQKINKSNHHMHPCSLLLQHAIQGSTWALSLFVTKKGRPIFVACCEQLFDERGHWSGCSISYKQQEFLSNIYLDIMERVAAFLYRRGYYGPAGVDVITDQAGNHYIVDLNARVPGSYHLGPLAGHFIQRGLLEVSMTTDYFYCPRSTFEETFSKEIENGSLIISGWVLDRSMRLSKAAINFGGRNSSEVEDIYKRVKAFRAPN